MSVQKVADGLREEDRHAFERCEFLCDEVSIGRSSHLGSGPADPTRLEVAAAEGGDQTAGAVAEGDLTHGVVLVIGWLLFDVHRQRQSVRHDEQSAAASLGGRGVAAGGAVGRGLGGGVCVVRLLRLAVAAARVLVVAPARPQAEILRTRAVRSAGRVGGVGSVGLLDQTKTRLLIDAQVSGRVRAVVVLVLKLPHSKTNQRAAVSCSCLPRRLR